MCGIVGYTGDSQAAPILLHGLSKLEYRAMTQQVWQSVTATKIQKS